MRKRLEVSAPGKIILSGEHAVVYGYPAILAAVNRRLSMNSQRVIDSNIPQGCGMGSSAAYAVALSALKIKLSGRPWNLEEINKMAYEMEKKHHGNPSGADNTISTYGGFLWYRKEAEGFKTFSSIEVKRKLSRFFVVNTGKPDESTKDMVTFVGSLYRRKPKAVENIFQEIEKTTKSFLGFLLGENDISFSDLIKINQRLLERLDVVSGLTTRLIRKIEEAGGAVKISGAGGKKNASGVLLTYHQDPDKLKNLLKKYNLDIFPVKLGEEGVRIE